MGSIKLPGTTYVKGAPKSLGLSNPGEPLSAANAEARAALAWGDTVNIAAGTTNSILNDIGDASRVQNISTNVMEDKQGFAMFEAQLGKNIYTQGVDEEIDNAAEAYKQGKADYKEGDVIPMAEIANSAWIAKARKITANRLQYFNEEEAAMYLNKMTPVVYGGTQRIATSTVARQMAALTAKQDAIYSRALSLGSEDDAEEALKEGFLNGAYTPEVYAQKMSTLGSTIDYMNSVDAIRNSTTQGELDSIEDRYETSRVMPEQKLRLNQEIDSQTGVLLRQKSTIQAATFDDGMSQFIEGKLTKEWINQQLVADNLTGEKAGTLLTRLSVGKSGASMPGIESKFRGAIASLRYLDEGETSVDKKSRALRREIKIAYSGVDENGKYIGPSTLSGGDYLKVNKELDTELGKLADANPNYKNIIEELRLQANYSNQMTSFEGKQANINAYTDAKSALDAYMDTQGAAADPVQWMKNNGQRFTLEVYQAIEDKGFLYKFPQYATGYRMKTGEGVGTFGDPNAPLDFDRIEADAYSKYQYGDMNLSEYEQIIRNTRRLRVKQGIE